MKAVTRILAAATTAMVAAGSVVLGVPAPVSAANDGVLCHATTSESRPYVAIRFKTDRPTGHAEHVGPIYLPGMTSGWGDIIPAYPGFAGLNNDGFGQAILAAGCVYPTADPRGYLEPIVSCFRYDGPEDVYQVLYSYRNLTPLTLTVAHGPDNLVTPDTMAPFSPEVFSPGFVLQGFAVTLPRGSSSPSEVLSTWTLAGRSAAFAAEGTPTCGPDVIVSADGNGAGWAIVAVLSALVVGIPVVWQLKRIGRHQKGMP
jgi:hypothetical protein